jgi:hypothetical protein
VGRRQLFLRLHGRGKPEAQVPGRSLPCVCKSVRLSLDASVPPPQGGSDLLRDRAQHPADTNKYMDYYKYMVNDQEDALTLTDSVLSKPAPQGWKGNMVHEQWSPIQRLKHC